METPTLPGLNVRRNMVGKKDGVKVYISLSHINPGRNIIAHNHTLKNLTRAIAERVLYRVGDDGVYRRAPQPLPDVLSSRLKEFRSALLRNLPPATPVALEEIPGMYVGRKKLIYQRAVDSLQHEPLTARDAWVDVFTKFEKVDATSKGDSAPRVISPRLPRYNASLGKYMKPGEKLLFKGIENVFGEITVAKGLNLLERGNLIASKWNSFKDPVAIGVDAKRFDQHVSLDALRWEHSCWNGWFKTKELRWLLSMQLRNKCRGFCAGGSVEYTVKGCRMSGDMNTSSGNCMLMCGMMYAYSHACGVETKLINDGDDCVIFLEKTNLSTLMDGFRQWFLDLGFDMVVESPVYEIEKIEFCQAHPVHVGGGEYVMVRNPMTSIAKDSVIMVNHHNHKDCVSSWLGAVGSALTAACGGIPVMQSFYQMYSRHGTSVAKLEKSYNLWWHNVISDGMKSRRGLPVLPETRLSFYIAFGILPDEQVAIEQHYDRMTLSVAQPTWPRGIIPNAANEIKEIFEESTRTAPIC